MKRALYLALAALLTLAWPSAAGAAATAIRILHVNDFHGFAEPYRAPGADRPLGGLAYLATAIERLRAEQPTLVLAAGDMIQGNNWANIGRGKGSIEAMNAIRFDAMVVGNHEFDYGQEELKKRMAEASFPFLGANVAGLDGLKPYLLTTIGGVRVAVIGVVTDDTPVTSHPRNTRDLAFEPPAQTVRRQLDALKGQADVFVVLSHLGHPADRELAAQVAGIDVIVGGHSHTRVDVPVMVGRTAVAQAWEHGKALGVIDLTVADGRVTQVAGRLVAIAPDADVADPAVAEIVARYAAQVSALLEAPAGEAAVDLDGTQVRARETNLGDLVADIVRSTAGADAAIINGGGIRTSILKGPVKVKDVYAVLPFDNYIVAVMLTGAQIRATLEYGVSAVEREEGRFPQVSGLAFSYSPAKAPGERVVGVTIGGRPLEPDREYSVATNDFLAAGGDGFKAFGDAVRSSKDFSVQGGAMRGSKLVYNDPGRWLRDIVADAFRAAGTVATKVDGRITALP